MTSSGLRPSTFRSSDHRRRARPIEPPISPSPTISTRCIGGYSLSSIDWRRREWLSRLIRLGEDFQHPALLTIFGPEAHPAITFIRSGGRGVFSHILQR